MLCKVIPFLFVARSLANYLRAPYITYLVEKSECFLNCGLLAGKKLKRQQHFLSPCTMSRYSLGYAINALCILTNVSHRLFWSLLHAQITCWLISLCGNLAVIGEESQRLSLVLGPLICRTPPQVAPTHTRGPPLSPLPINLKALSQVVLPPSPHHCTTEN